MSGNGALPCGVHNIYKAHQRVLSSGTRNCPLIARAAAEPRIDPHEAMRSRAAGETVCSIFACSVIAPVVAG
jgi:hypothetical protein